MPPENLPDFMPGLELARLFFEEVVKPLLDRDYPTLRYDAALIGSGSEVLGFDTAISRDHHWGPRVTLYVSEDDYPRYAEVLYEDLRHKLPHSFRGYPTSFEEVPGEPGVLRFRSSSSGPVEHRVYVSTVRREVQHILGWDCTTALTPLDWLTFPQQKLRTLTTGAVYHAGLGAVPDMQARLRVYPRDVRLYLLACGWARISEEAPFVGRSGDLGDEIGSSLIAARLVRDLMLLCFLYEQQYAPYANWFGTAFTRLQCSAALQPALQGVLRAQDWHTREAHLVEAYRQVAALHNACELTAPLPVLIADFHERPFKVLNSDDYVDALRRQIADDRLRVLAAAPLVGAVDQFSDSTPLREHPALFRRAIALYD